MEDVMMFIWQLPQNLLGMLLVRLFRCAKRTGYYVTCSGLMTGISLGRYIVIRSDLVRDITLRHEKGHQAQSRLLGPLYILLIGLPSLAGNLLHRLLKFDYYRQPWEAWADRLGGVVRRTIP